MPPEQSVDLRTYYAKHTQSVHDMTQTAVALLTGNLGFRHT